MIKITPEVAQLIYSRADINISFTEAYELYLLNKEIQLLDNIFKTSQSEKNPVAGE
jgi:hypothetical protein